MKDMNKAINHPSRHQKPIKKVVSAIHTHKMSNRRLSIKKWSSYSTSSSLLTRTAPSPRSCVESWPYLNSQHSRTCRVVAPHRVKNP